MTNIKTICWFGIYDPAFGRNRVYMKGLRESDVEIVECRDTSRGLLKYWHLRKKLRALEGRYDALVVGYPGHVVVPFAKFISQKPVIADLLGSLADAEMHSHGAGLIRRVKSAIIDRLAIRSADLVLLESEAQKRYFEKHYGVSTKYHVLYTGADDAVFRSGAAKPAGKFTVLFRGRLTPESGIPHILKSATLLKGETDIQFRIIGSGPLLSQAREYIAKNGLTNVELISEYLSENTLPEKMRGASLSLGQFEDNPRLSRTIPHKAFESFAMGIPYLSGNAPAVREAIIDGKTGFLSPLADFAALAEKIRVLRDDPASLARVGMAAREMFVERFSPRALSAVLYNAIERL